MEHDISQFLAFEVKKEIADRYFGFRHLIEEDKRALIARVREQEITGEQRICFDLIRIYLLLHDQELIGEFLQLAGLSEGLFFDPYFLDSPTIGRRVFTGIRARGMTEAGRFKRLLLESYESLEHHVDVYREKYGQLRAEEEMIREEIDSFERRHDLGSILDFLHRLDPGAAEAPVPVDRAAVNGELARRMRMAPPPSVEALLATVPPITPLPRIKRQMKRLADRAYTLHGSRFFASGFVS
ncbi:MAG: hypothetical protein AB1568_13545 [Thermodesulfobacteriota bacterium]